jgi:hypothetical protein
VPCGYHDSLPAVIEHCEKLLAERLEPGPIFQSGTHLRHLKGTALGIGQKVCGGSRFHDVSIFRCQRTITRASPMYHL